MVRLRRWHATHRLTRNPGLAPWATLFRSLRELGGVSREGCATNEVVPLPKAGEPLALGKVLELPLARAACRDHSLWCNRARSAFVRDSTGMETVASCWIGKPRISTEHDRTAVWKHVVIAVPRNGRICLSGRRLSLLRPLAHTHLQGRPAPITGRDHFQRARFRATEFRTGTRSRNLHLDAVRLGFSSSARIERQFVSRCSQPWSQFTAGRASFRGSGGVWGCACRCRP